MIDPTGSINSFEFGPGTAAHVVAATGLRHSGVQLATSDYQQPGDGADAGYARRGPRTIQLRLALIGWDGDDVLDTLDDLVAATPQLAHTLIPLVIDGYTIDVRVDARDPEYLFDRPQRTVEVDLALWAPDPDWTAVPP